MNEEHQKPLPEDFLSVNAGDIVRHQLGILTDTELASALRVTTNTLATWRGKKQGPKATSLGRAVYYRYSDVKSWIELEASQSAPE